MREVFLLQDRESGGHRTVDPRDLEAEAISFPLDVAAVRKGHRLCEQEQSGEQEHQERQGGDVRRIGEAESLTVTVDQVAEASVHGVQRYEHQGTEKGQQCPNMTEQVGGSFGNRFRMAKSLVAVGGKTRLASRHQRRIQMGRAAARNVRCTRIPADMIGQQIRVEA